jgi:hypothetical protein
VADSVPEESTGNTSAGDQSLPDELLKRVEQGVQEAIRSSAAATVREWKRTMARNLRAYRSELGGFEKRLAQRWQKPLDLYQLILLASLETGNELAAQYGQQERAEQDSTFQVLVLLQVRACYTASAIQTLLRSGHADAADAHWRTLHELAVAAYLIKEHGASLAERYQDFEYVEVWRNARAYQGVQGRLRKGAGGGYEPIPQEDFEQLRQKVDELRQKYGARYVEDDWGWAANLLSGSKKASFDAVERLVGLDHLRPFYRLGSLSAHATARSLALSVAERGPNRVLRAGPSNAGLATAGQGALISLNQVSVELFLHGYEQLDDPSLIVVMYALQTLLDEASHAFAQADDRLQEDEANVWQTLEDTQSGRSILGWIRDMLARGRS